MLHRSATPQIPYMKLSSISVLIATPILLAACNSLDNPFANLFKTGRDARVYNPQTGSFEWPADKATPRPQKSAHARPQPARLR